MSNIRRPTYYHHLIDALATPPTSPLKTGPYAGLHTISPIKNAQVKDSEKTIKTPTLKKCKPQNKLIRKLPQPLYRRQTQDKEDAEHPTSPDVPVEPDSEDPYGPISKIKYDHKNNLPFQIKV
jgi:hypothetical protein